MTLRPRDHLRLLRVLLACAVLGVVAPAPARAAVTVDAFAWIAGVAREAAAASQAPGARLAARSSVIEGAGADAPRRIDDPALAAARPAGARALVVRERIYLEHASILC